MDSETLVRVAEARAHSDTRVLKKVIVAFHALLDPSASPAQLLAAHASFSLALDALSDLLHRADRLHRVTTLEVESYRAEAAALAQAGDETRNALGQLGQQLARAQQDRARRIEYDGLAKVIARLPDRHKGLEQKQRLESDIALLESESRTYLETWHARKVAFDAIVGSLETMQEAIRDEKAEQERRRALDEDDDDNNSGEVDESDPAARSAEPAATAAALDPTAQEFVPGGAASAAAAEGEEEDVVMEEGEENSVRDGPPMVEEGEEGEEAEEGQVAGSRTGAEEGDRRTAR